MQIYTIGGLAQLAEHLTLNQGAIGSNPISSTNINNKKISFLRKSFFNYFMLIG